MKTFFVILVLCTSLLSCSVLPEAEPADIYQLPPSTLTGAAAASVLSGLRIATPATADSLGGTRILAMVGDNSFQAYPDARWAAPVPQLWRDWLLNAFWQDGRVAGLSASTDGLQASVELRGMLRALHNEVGDSAGVALIQYDAQLVDTATRQILRARRFEAREPVAGTSAGQLVAALGIAADRIAVELIAWTLSEQ
jgi:cholesterol transport system auxiliary component